MDPFFIRKATPGDIDTVISLFDTARAFMRAHGNSAQWINGFPPKELLQNDIEKGQMYLAEKDGRPCGVFVFILGEDPTYGVIENGKWLSDAPYGTLHRVASDGTAHGLFTAAVAFCNKITTHIRVDTHESNQTMQRVIAQNGFTRCGIIYIEDGSPRIAYEKL